MDDRFTQGAKVFKALCDEHRLFVLDLLKTGEKCACVILEKLDISQSTLSHHMKILCESGIVSSRQEGKWTYYFLSPQGCDKAKTLLHDITLQSETNEHTTECTPK